MLPLLQGSKPSPVCMEHVFGGRCFCLLLRKAFMLGVGEWRPVVMSTKDDVKDFNQKEPQNPHRHGPYTLGLWRPYLVFLWFPCKQTGAVTSRAPPRGRVTRGGNETLPPPPAFLPAPPLLSPPRPPPKGHHPFFVLHDAM